MKRLLTHKNWNIGFIYWFCLCAVSFSCKKDSEKYKDPLIEEHIAGLYKDGNYYWDKTDENGYGFGSDDSAKLNVDYLGEKQVRVNFITASKYPANKSYILDLTKDSVGTGIFYYNFRQTLDSNSSHFSNIMGRFQVYLEPFNQTILLLWYADATVKNGQLGPPGVSLSCTNFKKY